MGTRSAACGPRGPLQVVSDNDETVETDDIVGEAADGTRTTGLKGAAGNECWKWSRIMAGSDIYGEH
jgi:hypothetical protein